MDPLREKLTPFLGVAVLALVLLTGCTMQPAVSGPLVTSALPLSADASADSDGRLSHAVNRFGLDLARSVSTDATGNVIVSPASVHAALSMTVNGADSETEEQMRKVLHTDDMSAEEANRRWSALLTGFASRSPEQKLEVANSLWAREGIRFKRPFIDADRDYFGADVSVLDFENDDVAGTVNGWVSEHTHGMIPRMVEEVPDDTFLLLANAVYFEGDWSMPFAHRNTKSEPFARSDGTKVDVEMMNQTEQLPYYHDDVLQATRLDYKGADSSFYVLLPNPGVTIGDVLRSIDDDDFAAIRSSMTTREVRLGMPILTANFESSLMEPLADLGMPRAFDEDDAEFRAMAETAEPIYIGQVDHVAKVRIDEMGTVSSAGTLVGMRFGRAPGGPQPPQVLCNRPYAFAIVDEDSGTMLFLGVVKDPTQ